MVHRRGRCRAETPRNHPRLKNLYLTGTTVTDDGFRVLTKKRLPQLGGADVSGSRAAREGCERIGSGPRMYFDFYETGVGSIPETP